MLSFRSMSCLFIPCFSLVSSSIGCPKSQASMNILAFQENSQKVTPSCLPPKTVKWGYSFEMLQKILWVIPALWKFPLPVVHFQLYFGCLCLDLDLPKHLNLNQYWQWNLSSFLCTRILWNTHPSLSFLKVLPSETVKANVYISRAETLGQLFINALKRKREEMYHFETLDVSPFPHGNLWLMFQKTYAIPSVFSALCLCFKMWSLRCFPSILPLTS